MQEEEEEEVGQGEEGVNEPQGGGKQVETNQCKFTVKGNYVLTIRILPLAQRIGDQVFLIP